MVRTAVIFVAWAWPALLAIVPAVFVTWWAIFGDKARGRRRCPRCWHDLSGTPGLTCGECGHAARDELDLSATRRRWGVAAAAIAATAGIAAAVQLSILNATWASYLPDALLVRLPAVQPLAELPLRVQRELGTRVANGTLGADGLLALARSLASRGPLGAAEDPAAILLRSVARATPGELAPPPTTGGPPARDGAVALREWRARMEDVLRSIPAWTEVRGPARWPHAEPAVAFVRATVWGARSEWRIRRRGDAGPWVIGAGEAGVRAEPGSAAIEAGPISGDGRLRADFDFEVRRGEPEGGDWGAWEPAGTLAVDVAVEPIPEGTPADVSGPDFDAAVARALEPPMILWDDPARPVAFRINLWQLGEVAAVHPEEPSAPAAHAGSTAFGIVAELREGGTVRRRLRLATATWHKHHSWMLELEDAPALARLRALATAAGGTAALPGWTIELRSDRRAAMTAIARTPAREGATDERCWSGTVVLPATGAVVSEPAPQRSYRLGFSDQIPGNADNR